MEIEFRDERLALILTDKAAKTRLPVAVIEACRKKLIVIQSAPDERTLRNWRSLRFEKLKGDRKGQHSIRLNDQWRLIFELEKDGESTKFIILSIEDYH